MSNRADALVHQAGRIPTKAAVIFEGRTWTFADLLDQAKAYAAGLAEAGFGRGDKLGLMLATRPEFIALEYAAYILGGALVPMNIHYQGHEIEHALVSCSVEFLVLDSPFAERLAVDIVTRCPALRQVFVFGGVPAQCSALMHDAGALKADPAAAPAPVDLAKDEVAMMLYTSATTGKSKGVMLTIGNLEANYDTTPDFLHLTSEDVILCALPLYNTFGLNQCINVMVQRGATMVLLTSFDPLAWPACRQSRATGARSCPRCPPCCKSCCTTPMWNATTCTRCSASVSAPRRCRLPCSRACTSASVPKHGSSPAMG